MIAVILSSALSETYGNGEAAARRMNHGKVTVFDSRSATLGEGLLVVRGVELAAAGWSVWTGTKLNLKPVMALTMERTIEPIGRVHGKEAARRRILEASFTRSRTE